MPTTRGDLRNRNGPPFLCGRGLSTRKFLCYYTFLPLQQVEGITNGQACSNVPYFSSRFWSTQRRKQFPNEILWTKKAIHYSIRFIVFVHLWRKSETKFNGLSFIKFTYDSFSKTDLKETFLWTFIKIVSAHFLKVILRNWHYHVSVAL